MSVIIGFDTPAADEGFALFETAGWNAGYGISEDDYARGLTRSWAVATARRDGRLVAMGRVISDGALYALLVDVIVHPEVRGEGLGRAIVEALIARCREAGLRTALLFAAEGSEDFYARFGFRPRPGGRPGMELSLRDGA